MPGLANKNMDHPIKPNLISEGRQVGGKRLTGQLICIYT